MTVGLAGKGAVAMRNMFSGLAGRYDLANRAMSLGRDVFWRQALARRLKVLDEPGRLLDLAAGTGDQIVAAKTARPALEVTGLDLAPAMLHLAERKFTRFAPRPRLVVGDALATPFGEGEFDSVSISFGLRNVPDRAALMAEARRVLKPGGRFLVLEMFFDRLAPWAPAMRWYLNKVVPLVGGRLISHEREAYRYLAESIMGFPQPAELAREMAAAGFKGISYNTYTFHAAMLVWGDK